MKAKNESYISFLYIIYLYLAWASYIAFIYPGISTGGGLSELLEEVIRIIIFLLPLYFIRNLTGIPNYKSLGINGNFLQGVKIGAVFSLLYFVVMLPLTLIAKNQSFTLELNSNASVWAVLSVAVVVEEVVFRGYLLNYFERYGKITAIIASSLLFVLIHYPGWWLLDMQPSLFGWLQSSFSIFFVGVVLSIIFLRYRSLVACRKTQLTLWIFVSFP